MEQDSIKEELLEMFHRSAHLLHRSGPHFRRHGKRPPMPPAQDRLLRLLASTGPMTQRDLAEMLDIRSASISELLSKLERPGWIRRRPNETDKRTIDVNLTEEGENMLQNIGNERVDMAEEVFGSLTEEELRQLHSLLGKLIGDWETRFESERDRPRCDPEGRPDHGFGWFRRVREHFHHHHGPHFPEGSPDHHDHHDCERSGRDHEGRRPGDRRRHHDHRGPFGQDRCRASTAEGERAADHSERCRGQEGPGKSVRSESGRSDDD